MQRQLGEGRYRGSALRSGGSWGVNPHSGAGSLLGQALTVFQRSLTAMQIQVAGLLHFAVPMFPTAEVRRSPQCPRRGGGARGQGFREPGWGQVPPPHPPPPRSLAPLALEASVHPLLCVVLATAPSPPLSLCLSVCLSVCLSLGGSAQHPAPAKLLRVQPPPADGLVGLPRAAQGAGLALGGVRGVGTPPPSPRWPPFPRAARRGLEERLRGVLQAWGMGRKLGNGKVEAVPACLVLSSSCDRETR